LIEASKNEQTSFNLKKELKIKTIRDSKLNEFNIQEDLEDSNTEDFSDRKASLNIEFQINNEEKDQARISSNLSESNLIKNDSFRNSFFY